MVHPLRAARSDTFVPNDGPGFCLVPGELYDRLPREDAEGWEELAMRGLVLPVALDAEESFVAGLRLGPPSTQEREEQIGALRWWLELATGLLAITPGSLYWEGCDGSELPLFRVPPGRYAVTVLRFASGVNGRRWLPALHETLQRPAEYFAATRPDAELPPWLALLEALEIEADGSEVWDLEEEEFDALQEEVIAHSYLDFLVCLEPLAEPPPFPGFGPHPWLAEPAPQLPARCPLGIPAVDLLEPEEEPSLLEEAFHEVSSMIGDALGQLPQPEVLFEGASGRFSVWDQAAWMTPAFVAEGELHARGFRPLGTIGCDARPGVLYRLLAAGPSLAALARTVGEERVALYFRRPDGRLHETSGPLGEELFAAHAEALASGSGGPAPDDLAEAARWLDDGWRA